MEIILLGDCMKKYFISKDNNSFHVFYKGLTGLEKKKFQNDLRQNYNIEVKCHFKTDKSNDFRVVNREKNH